MSLNDYKQAFSPYCIKTTIEWCHYIDRCHYRWVSLGWIFCFIIIVMLYNNSVVFAILYNGAIIVMLYNNSVVFAILYNGAIIVMLYNNSVVFAILYNGAIILHRIIFKS